MTMKTEKSLLISFKLLERFTDLKKDSSCEECRFKLKAICGEEWRIFSQKNWCQAKEIARLLSSLTLHVLVILLFPVLMWMKSSQWWKDDIELPDVEVTEVEVTENETKLLSQWCSQSFVMARSFLIEVKVSEHFYSPYISVFRKKPRDNNSISTNYFKTCS